MIHFYAITLSGKDSAKFLQGQLTVNVNKLNTTPLACAICNLKGRVQFGLWASRLDEMAYELICTSEQLSDLLAHIKKYGAFSKFEVSEPTEVFATLLEGVPSFAQNMGDFEAWATASIEQGNYWITHATAELFQPQELRLHQRGGVDYDKGCYLGQEIVARLYFKASPKAYLHRVRLHTVAQAGDKLDKVQVVNVAPNGMDALVIGSPDEVAQVGEMLALPDALMASVART